MQKKTDLYSCSAANRGALKATMCPSKDSAGFVGYGDADRSNVSPEATPTPS